MLFDAPEVSFRISWWLLVASVGVVAATFARHHDRGRPRAAAAPDARSGEHDRDDRRRRAGALAPGGPGAHRAASSGGRWPRGVRVEEGRSVRVVGVEGLTLKVVKADEEGGAG